MSLQDYIYLLIEPAYWFTICLLAATLMLGSNDDDDYTTP